MAFASTFSRSMACFQSQTKGRGRKRKPLWKMRKFGGCFVGAKKRSISLTECLLLNKTSLSTWLGQGARESIMIQSRQSKFGSGHLARALGARQKFFASHAPKISFLSQYVKFLLQDFLINNKITKLLQQITRHKLFKCAFSILIVRNEFVGNFNQVYFVRELAINVQNHEVLEPFLSHR